MEYFMYFLTDERAHFQDGFIVIMLGSDDDILGKLKELFEFYRHTCSDFGFCVSIGSFLATSAV